MAGCSSHAARKIMEKVRMKNKSHLFLFSKFAGMVAVPLVELLDVIASTSKWWCNPEWKFGATQLAVGTVKTREGLNFYYEGNACAIRLQW